MNEALQEAPLPPIALLTFDNAFPEPPAEFDCEGGEQDELETKDIGPLTPEPVLSTFNNKTDGELEDEVVHFAIDYKKNKDALGQAIYELNERYKATDKNKGSGVKAFIKRLGPEWNQNRWSYWLRKYTPPDVKANNAAKNANKKAAAEAKHSNAATEKPEETNHPTPQPTTKPVSLFEKSNNENHQNEEIPVIESAPAKPTIDEAKAVIEKSLVGLSPAMQLEHLMELAQWIARRVDDLKEQQHPASRAA